MRTINNPIQNKTAKLFVGTPYLIFWNFQDIPNIKFILIKEKIPKGLSFPKASPTHQKSEKLQTTIFFSKLHFWKSLSTKTTKHHQTTPKAIYQKPPEHNGKHSKHNLQHMHGDWFVSGNQWHANSLHAYFLVNFFLLFCLIKVCIVSIALKNG